MFPERGGGEETASQYCTKSTPCHILPEGTACSLYRFSLLIGGKQTETVLSSLWKEMYSDGLL